MKIFIPPHIRKIGVVQDLCSLITGYAELKLNQEKEKDSLDHFYYYKTLSYDSVKSFIGICKSYNNQNDNSIIESEINYITNLFYSVKGTIKVFEYLTRFLDIVLDDYNYDIRTGELYINLNVDTYNNIFMKDEETFKNSFEKFLKAVLYIKNLSINVSIEKEEELLYIKIADNKNLYYDTKYHNYSLDKITPQLE